MRKIKLVHLLTLPDEEREEKSIENLSRLSDFGIEYIQNINEPYTELPPKETCMYPNKVSLETGYWMRSSAVYGCYLAHKNAVLQEFDDDIDFLLVCECDARTLIEPERLYAELTKICDVLEKEKDIVYVNLGEDIQEGFDRTPKETIDDALSIVDKTIGCMGVLYQKSSVGIVKEKFLNEKWDGADLWQNQVFINHRKAYSKIPLIGEYYGGSLMNRVDILEQSLQTGSLIDRVDIFNDLKTEGSKSLIAEIIIIENEPVLIYDKLNLLAEPFISDEEDRLRINLPFNKNARDIKIKDMGVVFYVRDYVVGCSVYPVTPTATWWWWWTHPYMKEYLEHGMKIKIYG